MATAIIREPVIDPLNYDTSLNKALKWYNINFKSADYKEWFVAKHNPTYNHNDLHDIEFRVVGVLTRLQENGNSLSDKDLLKFETEVVRLEQLAKDFKYKKESAVTTNTIKTPVVKVDNRVNDFCVEFNEMVDQFTLTKVVPDVTKLVERMNISGAIVNQITDKYTRIYNELREAKTGDDPILNEAYSNYGKIELRRLYQIYETLFDSLKVNRVKTPVKIQLNKVKVRTPLDQVKDVKYKLFDEELKIKSIHPKQIVGVKELYMYNCKYKTMIKLVSETGFTVKGTSIFDFDVNKSFNIRVKKPDFIKGLIGKTKTYFRDFISGLSTKASEAHGRINEDTIIIGVF